MRELEGPQSSMVVIRTTIPTGYVIARETIEWMYDNMDKVPGLKRVRFHDQSLWVFLDSVSDCFCVIFSLFIYSLLFSV